MGKTKDRGRYQSISLPVDFIADIKKHILKTNRYQSIAEFTKFAILNQMDIDDRKIMKL